MEHYEDPLSIMLLKDERTRLSQTDIMIDTILIVIMGIFVFLGVLVSIPLLMESSKSHNIVIIIAIQISA